MSDSTPPDLTPGQREQIYWEEKARLEATGKHAAGEQPTAENAAGERASKTGMTFVEDGAVGNTDSQQSVAGSEEAEALARQVRMQQLEKEEQDARARVQALLAFERQEKEAQQRRSDKLKQDYEETKAQEQQRLDKWQRGNRRQMERLRNWAFFFGLIYLLLLGFHWQIGYITTPLFCCLILGRILKAPGKWLVGFSVMAVPILFFLHVSAINQPSGPVVAEQSYQTKQAHEENIGKQIHLNAGQLYDLAQRDVAQVDPEMLDASEQKVLLRQARAELDEIGEPEHSSAKVTELYTKIDALWLAAKHKQSGNASGTSSSR